MVDLPTLTDEGHHRGDLAVAEEEVVEVAVVDIVLTAQEDVHILDHGLAHDPGRPGDGGGLTRDPEVVPDRDPTRADLDLVRHPIPARVAANTTAEARPHRAKEAVARKGVAEEAVAAPEAGVRVEMTVRAVPVAGVPVRHEVVRAAVEEVKHVVPAVLRQVVELLPALVGT